MAKPDSDPILVYVDLVLENGELVQIECPSKYEDELHESLKYAMKTRDWWSPSRFEGCTATYLAHYLEQVNMGKVIGMM